MAFQGLKCSGRADKLPLSGYRPRLKAGFLIKNRLIFLEIKSSQKQCASKKETTSYLHVQYVSAQFWTKFEENRRTLCCKNEKVLPQFNEFVYTKKNFLFLTVMSAKISQLTDIEANFNSSTWRWYFCLNQDTKEFFQLEIIINILVITVWFIWIPMLWVYGH